MLPIQMRCLKRTLFLLFLMPLLFTEEKKKRNNRTGTMCTAIFACKGQAKTLENPVAHEPFGLNKQSIDQSIDHTHEMGIMHCCMTIFMEASEV